MEETGSKLFDEGGVYHGFQIWLNMPSKYKFTAPSTAVYNSKNMGHIATNDYTATIVMGELFGQKSSVETLFPVFYIHLKLNAGCSLDVPTDPSHNAFVYTINGSIETSGRTQVSQNQVVLFERGKSDIRLFAKDNAEVLLLGGKPHNEQVVAYGPFVMNSEAEIIRCFNDYRSGKMGNAEVVNGKR
jgi:redox-sensitive bicupin YhaK (pirin superfamily)